MSPQLDLFAAPASEIIEQCRRTGILPVESETARFTAEERRDLSQAWLAGMHSVADASARFARAKFAARGWAFKWFLYWTPTTKEDVALSEALESALDVAERHFPRITPAQFKNPENMGIMQSKAFGGTEGVQIKQEAYGHMILVSVYCVTGPINFDASDGTLEFEPGAKSHKFHLLYEKFPEVATVCGDLAAYPLIKAESNRMTERRHTIWQSEGWTGPHNTRPHLHRPWNTIKAPAREALAA